MFQRMSCNDERKSIIITSATFKGCFFISNLAKNISVMLQQFQHHITTTFSFLKGKKIVLAVSGGIDSMVLMHLLMRSGYTFSVAHCNFQLRGQESDKDEEFVKMTCQEHYIPYFINRFETQKYADLHKKSIQIAARELRYNWFDELMHTNGYDFLLTAHHIDDSAETFLINFTRGTGLEGLTGIPQQNKNILRPLLPFSREEIERYAQENSVSWREDSSNASDKYFRNKIRHHILPILKELNPHFLNSFQQTLIHLQEAQCLVEEASSMVYEDVVEEKNDEKRFDLNKLQKLPHKTTYLYQWLKPYGFTAWNDIFDLTEAQSGKQIFSEDYRLLKDRDYLILSKKSEPQNESYKIEEELKQIDFPINLRLSDQSHITSHSKGTIFVDKLSLKFPLILRKWQEGDYFYPSGMQGKKKVSKYFKDEKFSLIDKEKTWLLCSENEIIWIINHRADQRFLANEKTQHILKIEVL